MALLEARPFRPFKSSEEYLYAMKEDLAEWLNALYPGLDLTADNFLDRLDTGVLLCKHANAVRQSALEFVARRQARGRPVSVVGGQSPAPAGGIAAPTGASLAMALSVLGDVRFLAAARPGTFFARDNVSNFILWCRRGLGVLECLLFETEDLIARKNEKHVILCLLEVARRGAKLGMLAPMLVHLEREIDREIALESNGNEIDEDSEDEPGFIGPMPQVITNDLKSLDEMVRELVERCQCPTQFPMIRVSEGKYRIGDTKVLIFVRILRSHVMVRVGGGWDTLAHYLDKHDPCRCRSGHRTTICAKLVLKNQGCIDMNTAQVHYERSPPRTRRSSASSVSSSGGGAVGVGTGTGTGTAGGMVPSPTPQRRIPRASLGASTASSRARSRSPNVDSTSITTGLTAPQQRGRRRSRSPGLAPNHRGSPSPSPSPGRAAPSQQSETVLLPVDNAEFPRAVRLRRSSANSEAPVDRTPAIAFLVPPPSSPPPQPPAATTTTTTHAGGDSGSDVGSDEGYRSLGIVTTPPSSAGRTNVDTATDGDPASRRTSSDLSEEEEVIGATEPDVSDDNSSPQKVAEPPVKVEVLAPELVVPTPIVASPRRASSVEPEHLCEEELGTFTKPATPGRRRSVGSEDMTTYLAASGRRPGPHGAHRAPGHGAPGHGTPGLGTPRREIQHQRLPQLRASESPCRNGRSRSASVEGQRCGGGSPVPSRRRPAPQSTGPSMGIRHSHSNSGSVMGGLGADPFLRGSPGRCSLPSRGRSASSAANTASGAVPAWPNKQKTISPILEQILQGSDLQDDAKVLQKMKDIIQHYAAIVDEKLAREEKQAQLDFTSAWVHGLPSSPPPSQVGQTPPTRFTPRKDSQPHVATSRIPAPVVHGKNRV